MAQAYTKRGDTKMAAQYFDKAQAILQAGLQKAASGAPVPATDISRPAIEIPFRLVGQHRRVRFDDLMAYNRRDDEARRRVADALTADAQELGMGY